MTHIQHVQLTIQEEKTQNDVPLNIPTARAQPGFKP
jgi:hypothetical protein